MNRISRAGATALCAGSLVLAGLVTGATGTVHAETAHQATVAPASVPAETTTVLPLLGVPLILTVTSGPGGALTDITLSPLAVPTADAGFTATKVEPDKVRFINDAGTVRVDVSSRHGGQNVSAKAGQLSDLVGAGSWSGDVFSNGTTTTVAFTISELAGSPGTPDITGIDVTGASNAIGTVEHRTEEDEQQARVSIRFTDGGLQTRTLTIRVQVGTDDDESQAKVSISLSRVKGLSLPSAEVVGDQSWTGLLCDGTAASIAYTVNDSGSITAVSTYPLTADVSQQSEKGISVSFSDHERVRIRVKTSDDDETIDGAMMRVSVDEKIRCDSGDPTVNVPVSTDDHSDDMDADHGDKGNDKSDHSASHDGADDQDDDEMAAGPSATSSTIEDSNDDDADHSDDDASDHSGSDEDGAGSGSHHG